MLDACLGTKVAVSLTGKENFIAATSILLAVFLIS